MRKYETEYQAWLKTDPLCACGCGKPLNTSYSAFERSKQVTTKKGCSHRYLRGHSGHTRGQNQRKYDHEYNEWMATNPICACGCGQPIDAIYARFVVQYSRNQQKRYPKYINGHGHPSFGKAELPPGCTPTNRTGQRQSNCQYYYRMFKEISTKTAWQHLSCEKCARFGK